MLFNEFVKLNIGDFVYNIFREELIISQINIDIKNNESVAVCVNTGLFAESYPYSLLYTNFDDLCDEELSFISWANANRNSLLDLHDNYMIEKIQKAYLQGYASGFSSKPKCSGGRCKV